MIKFGTYLFEDKNTHLEHLEDEIINNGLTGAKTAVRFLNSLNLYQLRSTYLLKSSRI